MNPPRQLKVCVQLGAPEEPIRGEVEAPSGERTAFSGWIGLVAAIEAARMPTPVEGRRIAGGEEKPETASVPRRTGEWSSPGARDMNQVLDR